MILNMACFYLVLGACGILVHPLRKRPHRSAINYLSRVIFAGGWAMFPVGILAQISGQTPYLPTFGLICGIMFILIVRRGVNHIDHVQLTELDRTNAPY